MLYESTRTLLRGMVDALERRGSPAWDELVESGFQCLFEMHQMSRSSYRAYRTGDADKRPGPVPHSERLRRAIPHVKSMLAAIRRKNQALARRSGHAALAEMNGAGELTTALSKRPATAAGGAR
jgi:hypothetical protein